MTNALLNSMVIAKMFHSHTTDSKILKAVVQPAKSVMQSTKAATSILLELHHSMKRNERVYTCFTSSGLDIAECMKADKIEGDPRQRYES